MKTLVVMALLTLPCSLTAQSIVGKWQLAKQTTCIDGDLPAAGETEHALVQEMKTKSSPAPQVVTFKDNNTAEESTRIVSDKKSYNSKNLLYKFAGETLYILDKRSQTIIEAFNVELISADSLIISNSSRACETKVFVRLK